MKLGIFLPNWIADRLDRQFLFDWATTAEEAGFDMLATIDRPNSDTWDPFPTLAAVAAVTSRIRLAPMVLQLPNRNAVLVAKESATVDRLSGGRFELGVGAAARRDDFAALGAKFSDRWSRFPRQIAQIRRIWAEAHAAESEDAVLGPAPIQAPGPPLWVAATLPETMRRAVTLGDGVILSQGNDALAGTADLVEWLRQEAEAAQKPTTLIGAVKFVAVDDGTVSPETALASLRRFYGAYAWTGIENMVLVGPPSSMAETVHTLADTGLDLLLLIPTIADLNQVHGLAEILLPTYAAP